MYKKVPKWILENNNRKSFFKVLLETYLIRRRSSKCELRRHFVTWYKSQLNKFESLEHTLHSSMLERAGSTSRMRGEAARGAPRLEAGAAARTSRGSRMHLRCRPQLCEYRLRGRVTVAAGCGASQERSEPRGAAGAWSRARRQWVMR